MICPEEGVWRCSFCGFAARLCRITVSWIFRTQHIDDPETYPYTLFLYYERAQSIKMAMAVLLRPLLLI
jgi:hypothetical protein